MEFREQHSSTEQIKDVRFSIDDDVVTLKWEWPDGIEYVYVYKMIGKCDSPVEIINENNSRLYTRSEYSNRNGYNEKIKEVGLFTYAIFPFISSGGRKQLIEQNGKDNRVVIATGKTNIYYSITPIKKFLSKRKVIRMEVKTDVPVDRNILCYVIKKDSYPLNKDDGRIARFLQDFEAGRTILPEIEINNDEYVRIFLADGKEHGEIYNLAHV
jgi:hypothetical protein